jgi:hypothetical protein
VKTLDNVKPSLIDSNPVMATRGKRKQPERLSERELKSYAIVRSHRNQNYERAAEMTAPVFITSNNK